MHHIRRCDHLAENAARRRDEKDGADCHQAVIADFVKLMHPLRCRELDGRKAHADRKRDDRRTEEAHNIRAKPLAASHRYN